MHRLSSRGNGTQSVAETLIEMVRRRASDQPDRRAFTFLLDGERQEQHISYSELDAAARGIAAGIQERAQPGDRALLLYPPGLDYVRAFYGCLFAGVAAVPLYPPGLNRLAPPVSRFADDCDAAVVLTPAALEEAIRAQPGLGERAIVGTDTDSDGAADSWSRPAVDGESLAVLQYTSGSTSFPKGVMLSHRNLLVNVATIADVMEQDQSSTGVSWLPPYHDMGLIGGVITPVFAGFPATLMSPLQFLERPARWLEAISRFAATITGAPNFAYELCLRRTSEEEVADLDLSTLTIALSGAEPILPRTVDRFSERFGANGFRKEAFFPAYGLAEGTLIVTGGRPRSLHADSRRLEAGEVVLRDEPGSGVRSLMPLGPPSGDARVAIVDPESRRRVPEGRVGEVWVAGPSVAKGYWQRPEENESTFHASLAGDEDDTPWLRTGDLGFMHDGEFVWTGRLKDLIVVRGRNVHPEDIEITVEASHPALRPGCGVAFAIEGDEEERLTIVQELRRGAEDQAVEAAATIRRAVSREHEVSVARVVLIEAGSAPKTSSGKKQRRGTRMLLQEGDLPVVRDWQAGATADGSPAVIAAGRSRPAPEIARWLVDHIANALGIDRAEVSSQTPLMDLGVSSVQAAELADDLGSWLGGELPVTLIFDHPTIERLAAHLGSGEAAAPEGPSGERRRGERRRSAAQQGVQEPVAVVGMGCRFPGAANPDALREMLRAGEHGIREVPLDRWDADALYDPELRTPGKVRTRFGGFVDGIDQFDPQFFGITPREARSIDPHQRLLLEVAWEALEDGAQAPDRVRGLQTGVFVGIGGIDYQARLARRLSLIDAHLGTGNSHSIAANRLSFLLDLRGPSMAIDTACSSSSVAIHLACLSLERGESDLALAGGANVILTPETTVAFSQARMLSTDGRCWSFDERANGYVRSEGCGFLVLKRLSEAIRDGNRIRAVIRGTAVNQDGQTNGLTAPSSKAQRAVIRTALERAGAEPHELSYVEAHGTGTPLGDPIEVEGIAGAIGPRRDESHRCAIGSVKGNIGHAETAAGVAGVIKTVLALEARELYPQPGFEQLNKRIKLDGTPLEVSSELREWPAGERPRLAGVNSFGFGGTNAHVLLEEAPAPLSTRNRHERPCQVLTLSARSGEALRELAGRYSRACADMPDESFPDACFTAQVGRSQFEHRAAIVAGSRSEAQERLAALADGDAGAASTGHVHGGGRPMVGFLFTGQGSQYVEMGRALREAEPTFRRALEECAQMMDAYLDHDILDVIDGLGPDGLLSDTRYTQPALFVLEWALAELWRSWGVEPDVVFGHSVGEYVAACVSGAMQLEDGVALIAERARLMSELPPGGGMRVVQSSEEHVSELLRESGQDVTLAAVNGPASVTMAGELSALEAIAARLGEEGIATRELAVSHAFHSPLMDPMLAPFESVAGRFDYSEPRIPLVSDVTGRPYEEAPDAEYWRSHTRSPVRFAEGVRSMLELGVEVFVELGPHPSLLNMGKRCVAGAGRAWVPSLRRRQDDLSTLLGSLGTLYVNGVEPDWHAFHRRWKRRPVQLPTYAFQRSRHWIDIEGDEGESDTGAALAGATTAGHPLLGRRLPAANVVLEGRLSVDRHPYLDDHRVQGRAILPATAYLEMAVAAATATDDAEGPSSVLRDVVLRQPLMLGDDVTRVQLSVAPLEGGEREVTVHSARGGGSNGSQSWTLHARATAGTGGPQPPPADVEALRRRCPEEVPAERIYDGLERRGLQYGPAFRGLRRAWRGERDVLAEVELPETLSADGYRAHPALLDACLHALAAAQPDPEDGEGPLVPVRMDSATIHAPLPDRVVVHARTAGPADAAESIADLTVLAPDGARLAELRGLQLMAIEGRSDDSADPGSWLYELAFEEPGEVAASPAVEGGDWLIMADRGGVGDELAQLLRAGGSRCVVAVRGEELRRMDDDRFAAPAAGLEQVLEEAFGEESPSGIVHMWGLDVPDPGGEGWLDDCLAAGCASLMSTVQALVGQKRRARLRVVTAGAQAVGDEGPGPDPAQATLLGFTRSIALEHPELRAATVDLDPDAAPAAAAAALAAELANDDEPAVALRGGGRHVARLRRRGASAPGEADSAGSNGSGPSRLEVPRSEAFRLRSSTAGVLDNLGLAPARRHGAGAGQVELEVRAAGLNFRDVMKAMGVYPGSAEDRRTLGDECAGVVVAVGPDVEGVAEGDEVVAVAPGAFGSHATTAAELVVPKPPELSFEQAAALPIAFMTAIHSLRHLARLSAGERCLIHAAAGGVGIAAVQVARAAGAEIYATAGNDEKRDLVRSLGVEHVMDSRSLAFADEILELTGGEGVDVVLNSLAGEAIPRSLALLRPFGRFVEIGKRDIFQNSRVGLRPFSRAISLHAVDLDRLLRERRAYGSELLRETMAGFADGTFEPPPVEVHRIDGAHRAFRTMAQARHVGKLVLSLEGLSADPPAGHTTIRADASYLITGGFGELGVAVARRLAERGAGALVLVGRRPPPDAVEAAAAELEAAGTRVMLEVADVTRAEDMTRVLARVRAEAPELRGIVHAAGALDDAFVVNLTEDRCRAVVAPKALGAWTLHELTTDASLDFLVLFSSATAVLGSPGQAHYAAGNAFMDALAERRARAGLRTLSIGWGAWSEIGMAARAGEGSRSIVAAAGAIAPEQGLDLLERLIGEDVTCVEVLPFDWERLGSLFPALTRSPLLSGLTDTSGDARMSDPGAAEVLAAGPEDLGPALQRFVRRELARVVEMDPEELDPQVSVHDIGLDSMMALELKNRVEGSLDVELPVVDLMEGLSIAELATRLAGLVRAARERNGGTTAAAQPAPAEDGEPAVAEPAPAG